jgi:hypothetical protein
MLWLKSLYRQTQFHWKAQLMPCLYHWALAPAQPEGYPAEVPPLFLTQQPACIRTVRRVYGADADRRCGCRGSKAGAGKIGLRQERSKGVIVSRRGRGSRR